MTTFKFFRVDKDKDTALMKEIYRLRYEVYCEEMRFLPAEKYAEKLEQDEYDDNSIHFAAIADDGDLVGTARLVLNDGSQFPLEKYCKKLWFDRKRDMAPEGFKLAEISRLVVSKSFRRRADDGLFGVESYTGRDKRRKKPQIVIGLYREIYQESKRLGITHWYAAMESKLQYALKRFSFYLEQIGPEVDYYGPVIPYIGEIQLVEERFFRQHPNSADDMLLGLEKKYWPDVNKKTYAPVASEFNPELVTQAEVADKIIKSIDYLEPLGRHTLKIIELSRNPSENFEEIIRVIQSDPGLTANFLRLCNSCYYGLPHQIDSVERAIILLGTKQLVKVIWANLSMLSPTFEEPREGYGLAAGELWRHSVSTAIISQMLLKITGNPEDPLLFTAALLHDIGKIVLDQYIRHNMDNLMGLCEKSILGYPIIEKAYFGIDHAELGGKIAKKWQFPKELQNAIKNHHRFLTMPSPSELDIWTGLSNIVSHFVQTHGGFQHKRDGITVFINNGILDQHGITQGDIYDVLRKYPAELNKILSSVR